MNFQGIMKKNMLFHARKYISIYIVYALIVTLLFLFASLLYNKAIIQTLKPSYYQNLQLALSMVVAFSVIFITYATVSFVKYRGQEFGTYIILGMTSKQVIRLLGFEQLMITGSSLATGLLAGIVFGKLFYLGFQQFIHIPELTFQLNTASFGITIAIFLSIMMVTFFLSALYIKHVSLVQLIRAKTLKEATKGSYLLGFISIFLFVGSLWVVPYAMENRHETLLKMAVALTLITPYFMIGAGLLVIKHIIMKISPKFYQYLMLTLSNVTHRLRAFQTTLYLVMIMLGGSIVFMGLAYVLYASTEEMNDASNPASYMYVTSKDWQGLDEQSETFDFVVDNYARQIQGEWGKPLDIIVVSKTQYENYMHEKITTPALIRNDKELEPFKTPIKWNGMTLKDVQHLSRAVTNSSLFGYNIQEILVVDDPSIYQGDIFTAHKLGHKVSKAEALAYEKKLKSINKVDKIPSQYDPASKELELESDFQRTGLALFISSFIGLLFVLASGIVLFYKVLSDLPAQKEYMQSLERIGLRRSEKKQLIRNELCILFFTPFFLSVMLVSYYFYLFFHRFPNTWDYMQKLGLVVIVFFVIQFIFYSYSRVRCEWETNL